MIAQILAFLGTLLDLIAKIVTRTILALVLLVLFGVISIFSFCILALKLLS